MTDRLIIVGAGLAGLLAARLLRDRNPLVIEAAKSLPHNHSAVLRFRSNVVAVSTGIPFRKVQVVRTTVPWKNPAADAIAYAKKVSGEYRSDRSINREQTTVERYIAPPDFIERLAKGTEIGFGRPFDFPLDFPKVISTIPMHRLMDVLDYPGKKEIEGGFKYQSGVNVLATVRGADAYASVYVPNPDLPFSRVSITGDGLIVEMPGDFSELVDNRANHSLVEEIAWTAAALLGIEKMDLEPSSIMAARQNYSKIVPIDEGERRRFIHWASTVKGRAFSLGRFATWRPSLLLDDLVQDIRVIEGLMDSPSSGYDAEKIERTKGATT